MFVNFGIAVDDAVCVDVVADNFGSKSSRAQVCRFDGEMLNLPYHTSHHVLLP